MAGVFPAERDYRFSSSLMNLKFMKKTTADPNLSSALSKHSVSGPALTILEASRREMEARQQLPGTAVFQEENSITRLFDLVVGRFSFRGINPVLEAALNCDNDNLAEDGEMENNNTDGRDVTDAEMVERYSSVVNTVAGKFTGRGGKGIKRPSDDSVWPSKKPQTGDHSKTQLHSERKEENKTGSQQQGRYFTMYNNADRGRHDRNSKKTTGSRRGGRS